MEESDRAFAADAHSARHEAFGPLGGIALALGGGSTERVG